MSRAHRVLHPKPDLSLDDYLRRKGHVGLTRARSLEPAEIIDIVGKSGLRGRGGAGFPVGRKWQTVAGNARAHGHPTVVVNGAEGEPGTFKDRTILRNSPYIVLEGALIAARAIGADLIVIALKETFRQEVQRVRAAIDELDPATSAGVDWLVFEGPDEYLYGEESALLETIDGRFPFPRIVPTFRRGVQGASSVEDGWPPPALVNNVETIANVGRILARGADWYRTVGTEESPGTVICTVTGHTKRHGVAEMRMGTPLREVIDEIGGGARRGRIKAVLPGVANPVIPGDSLDAPVSYEGLASIGSGLGSAGFMVFDESADMVAVAAGVARFLAVESCGQCSPCKLDGITLAELLAKLSRSQATTRDLETIRRRAETVSYGARCYLGLQQEIVISSILERFEPEFEAHLDGSTPPAEPELIAELLDIDGERAIVDEHHSEKQPDWTFNPRSSGAVPVELLSGVVPPWQSKTQLP